MGYCKRQDVVLIKQLKNMTNKTKCPKCGFEFDVDELIQQQVEESIKSKYDLLLKQNEIKLKSDFEKEKILIEQESTNNAKKQVELELEKLRDDFNKTSNENLELRKKELELIKRESELETMQEKMKIDFERQLLEKRKDMEDSIRKTEVAKVEVKFMEYEKQLDDQKKLIDELKRKAEHIPNQLKGEVQEIVLENHLKSLYPFDKIQEVPKGVRGADVIQVVCDDNQQTCGVIVYESKRTKFFKDEYIDKLKDDQRKIKADIAVIVTEVMPKGFNKFAKIEGVWVCTYPEVSSVSFVLREMLIKLNSFANSQDNKHDKMSLLYNYLTGNEFKQQVEAIVEGFTDLKINLDKEKNAMQKIWKEREKQIEKVIANTIDMYGSIKGIAGNAIGTIDALELPPH